MWKTAPDGRAAKMNGSAGQTMTIREPHPADVLNEMLFVVQCDDIIHCTYVNAEDRAELIRFLVSRTPGWDQT